MIDLSRKLDDNLVLDDVTFPLDLSFGNVLRLLEMLHDEAVPLAVQPHLALVMLISEDDQAKKEEFLSRLSLEEAFDIFKAISDEHIVVQKVKSKAPVYDLAGNLMISAQEDDEEEEEEERLFSLKYDGDYIFSSFMQAYGIDLVDSQSRLHWQKFHALLNGLPSDTKFMEVIKIRSWEPGKDDSSDYISKMKQLQDEFALPEDIPY